MKTVVVTGAAGSVGSRTVSRLACEPGVAKVVAIDVADMDKPPLAQDGACVERLRLDLDPARHPDSAQLQGALASADVVVHLAWSGDDASPEGTAEVEANRRVLANLLSAISGSSVSKLVVLSSATVYGAWPDNKVPLTEEDPLRPNPGFCFAVAKAETERALSAWARSHPAVQVVVLRPVVTLGPEGRPLYRALGSVHAPRLGPGERPVQYLHVTDLANAIVVAATAPLEGAFNVAPDRGISEDQARQLVGGASRLPAVGPLTPRLVSLGWRLGRSWGIPRSAIPYALYPWVVAPDRLLAMGWQPEYSSEEALVATDERAHWDDLPPGRRQNYNLLLLLGLSSALAGLGVLVAASIRRRLDRRR
jgi:nucleoside-diphosphate-sugar epimerase